MPPADNNVPAPQEPKKGFFAKLFGGGKKKGASESVVPSAHESQTPPPQLNDTQDFVVSEEGMAPVVPIGDTVPTVAPAATPEAVPSAGTVPAPEAAPVEPSVAAPVAPAEEQKPPVGPVPPVQ